MELAAFSDRGIGTRERLEDYAADRIITTAGGLQLQIAMVCDGAGGGEAGELAARLTSRTIFEYLEISPETSVPKLLIRAVEQANKTVYSELRGTGTSTVSMAAVHLNDGSPYGRLYIANVGNSRVYLMRGGRIARLNIDHTLANEYVFAGQMSFEEAKQLDDPEYVTRAIGIGAQVSVDIGFYVERGKNFVNSRRAFRIGQRGMELQEGDTVFAASDGLFPYVQDDEFLEYALDDDVERTTRTLLKYAADRGPEDNIALSVLFVPSRNRKMVQTGPRLSTTQRAGIGIFLLAVILLIGFLALQVASGENQRVAFLSTQTLVQQMIIEASYTRTPTPLPPTATPTQAIIVGQVGNRFSLTQSGLKVFTGRYIDPLQPPEINYVGVAGQNALASGNINQANLYLDPSTSMRLNKVDDTPGKEHIDMMLGRGGDVFANMGDFSHGGITISLEQNPDFLIQSQSACLSVHQILADPTKLDDTDKVSLACYGNGGSCTYQLPGADPQSVAPGQQALLDVNNQKLISTDAISQAQMTTYRSNIWQLSQRPEQLSCISNWLDEDKDGINYPADQCPADYGSVAAHGCPDKDNDGVPDALDQCPVDAGPASNNGCPLPDVDGDGLAGANDACPFDAGPASNQGCPTEGAVATQYAETLAAAANQPTPTQTPSPTATHTPQPSPTPTETAIPLPNALNDSYSTLGNTALTISAPGLLANDFVNEGTITPFSTVTTRGGAVSVNADGSFTYTPPKDFVGTDGFSYTLTNTVGSDSAAVTITVLQPPPVKPVAAFSASPQSGSAPLDVTFTDASTGPINVYTWAFGDGGTSNSANPSHTYTSAGTYSVTLTVSGPGGTDTVSHTVIVNVPPPIACFNPTSATITVGGTVNFNASCTTGATSYSWTFGDGGTGSGQTPSHTYTTANTFTVKLTVTGAGGTTSATGTVTVTVAAPVACFTPTNLNIATGVPVNFNAGCSTNATSYSWTFGDGGTGSGVAPTHTYSTTNTFTVTLTVTGPGGTTNTTGTVTVNAAPNACFTPTSTGVAPGGTVNFNAGCSTGGVTYSWSFGDSSSGTGQTTSHVYAAAGTYTVVLTVTGAGGAVATATGTVTVGTPATAVNDNYTVVVNNILNVPAPGVLTNDTLNGAKITTNTNPTKGTLSLNTTNGGFTYTPNAGIGGADSFTYTLTNNGGNRTATVNICITPLVTNDAYATTRNTTLTVAAKGVLANDVVPTTATTLTFTAASTQGGTVAITTTGANEGRLVYNPPNGFTGTDTFTYTLTVGGCAVTATVTITVMATNTVPVANNDTYTTPFKTALVVPAAGVLTNDNDADGNTLTATLGTNVSNGTLVFNSNGSFTYTPTGSFSGADSFTYTASDGISTSAAATVTITVNANTPPVAVADAYNTPPNTALTVAAPGILANDTDAEGSPLTAVLVTAPPAAAGTLTLNANGSFTFTPQAAFTGPTTFTYHANDGTSNSTDVTVTINVAVNNPPVAVADAYTTAEDTPLVVPALTGVLANDSDPDGNAITAVPVGGASSGTVTLNADGSFTYTPAANFNGTATFTYHAADISLNSANVTVTITVTPVNDPPVAVDDAYGTGYLTPRTVAAPGVLGNDTDVDGDTLQAFVIIPPFSGSGLVLNTDGSFTYIPSPTTFGTDIFLYEVTDGIDYAIAAVYINVGINTPPVAVGDTYTVPINTQLTVSAPGTLLNDSDADGNPLTAVSPSAPSAGTLDTFNPDGSFSLTPPNGFTGTITFTYMANDGITNSAPATVTVNVGINSPPTANNDTYATTVNKTLTVAAPGVLSNDNDLDGNPITAVLAAGPTNGTLTLNADGSFTYAPNTGFKGTDTFTYNANDGTVNSATTATVTIAVGVAPRKPVAVQLPAPPPATRCTDTNFENPGMIRSHFTNDIDRDQLFCRLIAANGNYMYWFGSPITNAGNVGAQNVLDLGLVAAVDVFSMREATGFVGDVDICLKGSGYMIYMNANGAPRVPQLWSAWTTPAFPGYTCTTLYAPGTVILVANKPQ